MSSIYAVLSTPMNDPLHQSCRRFSLEGRFTGFSPKKKKKPFKYLQLLTASGEYQIKLPKHLQIEVVACFTPGHWVQITGTCKHKTDGSIQLKADAIAHANPAMGPSGAVGLKADEATTSELQPKLQPRPASKILICGSSGCTKRGGKAVHRQLIARLQELGLSDQIKIQSTGCMGCCKSGPNLIFMPDKARYSRVQPDAVSDLIRHHL